MIEGLEKAAGVSFNKLLSALRVAPGSKAQFLFHGTNPESLAKMVGLVKNQPAQAAVRGKVVTPVEAKLRGLLGDYEGGYAGVRREAGRMSDVSGFSKLIGDRAYVNEARLAKKMLSKTRFNGESDTQRRLANNVAGQYLPGSVGKYDQSDYLSSVSTALGMPKNWLSTSFLRGAPAQGYGNAGIVTTPKGVSGELVDVRGGEIQAHLTNGRGVGKQLPTAEGAAFYLPSSTDIASNRAHDAAGYFPLTGRIRRALAAKNSDIKLEDMEKGNLSYADKKPLMDATPEYGKIKQKLLKIFGNSGLGEKYKRDYP